MRRKFEDWEICYIRMYYPENGSGWCAKKLNRSSQSIKTIVYRLKLKRTNYRYNFTKEELNYIRSHYSTTLTPEMAKKLNCSVPGIYNRAFKMGLKKDEEFHYQINFNLGKKLQEKGKNYQFKKGHIPENKGKKMSAELKEKIKHTFFQKGHKSVNTKSDGAITIRNNRKRKTSYKYIRISENNWMELQIYNWINKYGPVPEGKILVCKNGDTLNCDPDNWMLIDRIQHLERNSGRAELEDKYVARMISPRDKEIQEIIKEAPELIEIKRNQLKLKRTIDECN